MMTDYNPPTDYMHKAALACTDPLWIQHRFLAYGRGETTDNGTATFIKFGGRLYIVTCAHVVDAAKGDNVPALVIDRIMLNCAAFHNDGKDQPVYRHKFRFPDRDRFDIAIMPMTDCHWGLFQEKKGKVAIDLDNWDDVPWTQTSYIAAGYPNEHKYSTEDKVAAGLALVVADAASSMSPTAATFVLHSTLQEPHGYYFSGISGGPIFLPLDADKLVPVGIVIEGGPSSGRFEQDSIIGGSNDIFVRGHTLTPAIFGEWLQLTGVGK